MVPRTTRELHPFDEMDRLFDRLTDSGFLRPFDWRWPDLPGLRMMEERMPRVDVIDREKEVLVRAELPGMKKDELDISLSHDLLTIRGETREEKEEQGEWFRSEIRRGSFTRTVRLPDEVAAEKATAHFDAGILEIIMPKTSEAKRHTIKLT